MPEYRKNFSGELLIKPKSVSNWIDYSSNLVNGSISAQFDNSRGMTVNIIDPDKELASSFEIGYDVKLKLGFDDLPDNYIFNGFIGTNGLDDTESGYSLQCYDFVNQAVTENVYLTKPDEPYKNIYGNIVYRKGYDGWECYNVVQDLFDSLYGAPLTVGGKGTNPMKKIRTEDSFYGMGTKKSFADKALALCTDTDLNTNPYPLAYHYFQTNSSSESTLNFIKEKDLDSATPEYYFDDRSFMLNSNLVRNIDQYTSARVKDTDIYYKPASARATYGEKCILLDKKYESYDNNYQMAVDLVERLRFPRTSFEILVFDGLDIELGNIVEIQSDIKPSIKGTYMVHGINYEFNDSSVTTKLSLNNKATNLKDVIQLK